ncbi:hypothetical protein ACYCSU_16415 [Paenibacillus sp. ALE1]
MNPLICVTIILLNVLEMDSLELSLLILTRNSLIQATGSVIELDINKINEYIERNKEQFYNNLHQAQSSNRSVNVRNRPKLKGKDAERFLERSNKNKEFMRNHASKKVKEFHEQLNNNSTSASTLLKSLQEGQQKYRKTLDELSET